MKPRKPIPKRSAKGKRLDYADDLMREIIKIKRGTKCQICGRPGTGMFHIAEKGASSYPNIRYYEWNILWACWFGCHNPWHHYGRNHPQTERIHKRLQELRGEHYWRELMMLNQMAPKITIFQLELIIVALRQELKGLRI